MRLILTVLSRSALSVCVIAPALTQQFVHQNNLLPGPHRWTEGVTAEDVDLDGDLDLMFAEGDGFTSAGAQRQCRLLINQFVPTGNLTFTDESVARLGTRLANGKNVISGDVNGDGWPDLLYVNAFNTQVPYLFINRGASQPGFFDMQSATRGLTEVYNGGGAAFGDLDDDGDLDLIISDSGSSYLGGGGGRPRMFRNDGNGFFTEDAASLNAPIKRAQMDVQLVDLDGDFDLDFFGPNRSSNTGGNHYLMLNDGTGVFTNVSNTLPGNSSTVYEAEVGDLDGDTDIDMFFVSLSGFNEGHIENTNPLGNPPNWSLGGSLSGSGDDNEVVLIDYDNDSDYDALIGSLSSREYLWRNNGNLNWSNAASQIQAVSDSTLDATVADLDNDGDYDLITAQGESNSAQWRSKVYLNTGSADTLPPVLVATDLPNASFPGWPAVFHVKIKDQVIDDGVNYVSARGLAAPLNGPGPLVSLQPSGFSVPQVTLGAGQTLLLQNGTASTQEFHLLGSFTDTITLVAGATIERILLSSGPWSLLAVSTGAQVIVNVTPAASAIEVLAQGGQQYRFSADPVLGGTTGLWAVECVFTDWAGNTMVLTDNFVAPGPLGTNYCSPAVQNSSGQPGSMSAIGSLAVADQNLTLMASQLPPGKFGYFLVSANQGLIVGPGGSQGNLCLGSPIGRFVSQVQNSGPTGSFSIVVNMNSLPTAPPVAILPGDTWNFTTWYRDVNPGSTSNFTDGLQLDFQ
jgi:hypothetical protein